MRGPKQRAAVARPGAVATASSVVPSSVPTGRLSAGGRLLDSLTRPAATGRALAMPPARLASSSSLRTVALAVQAYDVDRLALARARSEFDSLVAGVARSSLGRWFRHGRGRCSGAGAALTVMLPSDTPHGITHGSRCVGHPPSRFRFASRRRSDAVRARAASRGGREREQGRAGQGRAGQRQQSEVAMLRMCVCVFVCVLVPCQRWCWLVPVLVLDHCCCLCWTTACWCLLDLQPSLPQPSLCSPSQKCHARQPCTAPAAHWPLRYIDNLAARPMTNCPRPPASGCPHAGPRQQFWAQIHRVRQ